MPNGRYAKCLITPRRAVELSTNSDKPKSVSIVGNVIGTDRNTKMTVAITDSVVSLGETHVVGLGTTGGDFCFFAGPNVGCVPLQVDLPNSIVSPGYGVSGQTCSNYWGSLCMGQSSGLSGLAFTGPSAAFGCMCVCACTADYTHACWLQAQEPGVTAGVATVYGVFLTNSCCQSAAYYGFDGTEQHRSFNQHCAVCGYACDSFLGDSWALNYLTFDINNGVGQTVSGRYTQRAWSNCCYGCVGAGITFGCNFLGIGQTSVLKYQGNSGHTQDRIFQNNPQATDKPCYASVSGLKVGARFGGTEIINPTLGLYRRNNPVLNAQCTYCTTTDGSTHVPWFCCCYRQNIVHSSFIGWTVDFHGCLRLITGCHVKTPDQAAQIWLNPQCNCGADICNGEDVVIGYSKPINGIGNTAPYSPTADNGNPGAYPGLSLTIMPCIACFKMCSARSKSHDALASGGINWYMMDSRCYCCRIQGISCTSACMPMALGQVNFAYQGTFICGGAYKCYYYASIKECYNCCHSGWEPYCCLVPGMTCSGMICICCCYNFFDSCRNGVTGCCSRWIVGDMICPHRTGASYEGFNCSKCVKCRCFFISTAYWCTAPCTSSAEVYMNSYGVKSAETNCASLIWFQTCFRSINSPWYPACGGQPLETRETLTDLYISGGSTCNDYGPGVTKEGDSCYWIAYPDVRTDGTRYHICYSCLHVSLMTVAIQNAPTNIALTQCVASLNYTPGYSVEFPIKYWSWNPHVMSCAGNKGCVYLMARSSCCCECGIFSLDYDLLREAQAPQNDKKTQAYYCCIRLSNSDLNPNFYHTDGPFACCGYFKKLADYPKEMTCPELFSNYGVQCVSCLARLDTCHWTISIWDHLRNQWRPFYTHDLINWKPTVNPPQYGETNFTANYMGIGMTHNVYNQNYGGGANGTLTAEISIGSTTDGTVDCMYLRCNHFMKCVDKVDIIDEEIVFNSYERTGIVLSCDDKVYINNDSDECVSVKVWGFDAS